MMRISQETGLIKPLNLSKKAYKKKFRSNLPAGIVVLVSTLVTNDTTIGSVSPTLRRIKHVVNSLSGSGQWDLWGTLQTVHSSEIHYVMVAGVLIPELEAVLTPEQNAWMFEGRYHQVGFHLGPVLDIVQAAAESGMAMTLVDWWACQAKSLQPEFHSTAQFSEPLAEHHNDLVSNLYADDLAFWNERLVQARNEILVVVRAADAGENPIAALNEFRQSGREGFLW